MLIPNERERLLHILDAIEKTDQALAGYDYADFVAIQAIPELYQQIKQSLDGG